MNTELPPQVADLEDQRLFDRVRDITADVRFRLGRAAAAGLENEYCEDRIVRT